MSIRQFIYLSLIALFVSTPVLGAVPDADIDAAAQQYQKLFTNSREAGDRPVQADMGDFVDKAFEKIPVEQLTLDQIEHAIQVVPVQFSVKTDKAMDQYLVKLSEANDANGARAAILRIGLLPTNATAEDRAKLVSAALAHPGIKQAIAAGYGTGLFEAGESLTAEALKSMHDSYMELGDSINSNAPASFYTTGARFFLSIVHTLGPDDAKIFSPLREKLAAALDQKLKQQTGIDPADQKRLDTALAQLNGAFARCELIGHPAPNIDFIWFDDPSDPNHKIKSLEDLKGKVVVLDFFATWCGPCIASFPRVKAVQHYYRGYDVVVVGITSIQGFHSTPTGRIDTKGHPEKEMALMPSFMKEHDMAWNVAFSKQPVFNPDYGVTGIPNMVIIDTKGIVRYASLHPDGPIAEKTSKIDPLLAEGGKTVPATLIEMKKPE